MHKFVLILAFLFQVCDLEYVTTTRFWLNLTCNGKPAIGRLGFFYTRATETMITKIYPILDTKMTAKDWPFTKDINSWTYFDQEAWSFELVFLTDCYILNQWNRWKRECCAHEFTFASYVEGTGTKGVKSNWLSSDFARERTPRRRIGKCSFEMRTANPKIQRLRDQRNGIRREQERKYKKQCEYDIEEHPRDKNGLAFPDWYLDDQNTIDLKDLLINMADYQFDACGNSNFQWKGMRGIVPVDGPLLTVRRICAPKDGNITKRGWLICDPSFAYGHNIASFESEEGKRLSKYDVLGKCPK